MAGAGFKDFVAGDILTAAQVDTYLMQQSVMCFASDAARDSALSGSLSEGLHCYTADNNRLYYYNGSAWVILSEPRQTWSAVTVTQGSSVSGTVNIGWYQRRNGVFMAQINWTASAAGAGQDPITVSTPITLQGSTYVGGSWVISDAGGPYAAGVPYTSSTSAVSLAATGAGLYGDTVGDIIIASGDVLSLTLISAY